MRTLQQIILDGAHGDRIVPTAIDVAKRRLESLPNDEALVNALGLLKELAAFFESLGRAAAAASLAEVVAYGVTALLVPRRRRQERGHARRHRAWLNRAGLDVPTMVDSPSGGLRPRTLLHERAVRLCQPIIVYAGTFRAGWPVRKRPQGWGPNGRRKE